MTVPGAQTLPTRTALPCPAPQLPGSFRPAGNTFIAAPERAGITHYLVLLYLFLYCSRLPEFIPQARVSAVLMVALLCVMALTLRAEALLKIPCGKLLVSFTLWVGLCVPFSVWMGGSVEAFMSNFQTLLILALMAAFIRTLPDAFRAMYVIGFATAFAAAMSFVFGSQLSDRLIVGYGTLGDPNYYCFYVLTGLPFLWMGVTLYKGLKRAGFLLLMVPVLIVVGRTGSRMGLIALGTGILFLFIWSSVMQKIYLILTTAVLIFVGITILPESLTKRFVTFFEANEDTRYDSSAATESAEVRKLAFFRSLDMTVKNPIVGVGPGMFTVAEAGDAEQDGKRGIWIASHNLYTQYSSEIGIPGALIYIAGIVSGYRGLSRTRKKGFDEPTRRAALFTQMSIVMVGVCAMFLSLGYGGIPFILIALSGIFQLALKNHIAAAGQTARAPRTGNTPSA